MHMSIVGQGWPGTAELHIRQKPIGRDAEIRATWLGSRNRFLADMGHRLDRIIPLRERSRQWPHRRNRRPAESRDSHGPAISGTDGLVQLTDRRDRRSQSILNLLKGFPGRRGIRFRIVLSNNRRNSSCNGLLTLFEMRFFICRAIKGQESLSSVFEDG
jgi:hypothetical protein